MTGSRRKKAMRLVLETAERGRSTHFDDTRAVDHRMDEADGANGVEQLEELLVPYLEAQAEQFPSEQVETVLSTSADLGSQGNTANSEATLQEELDVILTKWLKREREVIGDTLSGVLAVAAFAAFTRAFARGMRKLGLTLRPRPEMQGLLRRWARHHLDGFLDEYEQAIKAGIKEIVSEGLESGLALKDIIAQIESFVDDWRARAKRMAQDEATVAREKGVFEANFILGATAKQWITAGDSRVCPICKANKAQGAVPIERTFVSGHRTPPAHPWCRCETHYLGINRESALRAL